MNTNVKTKVNITHFKKNVEAFYIYFFMNDPLCLTRGKYMININTNKCVKNSWVCFQVLNFFPDKYAETAAFEKYNSNDRLVDDWLKCWTCLKPIVTFADLRGFSSAWEITFICTHW